MEDETVLDHDMDRLSRAYKDHEADHGCHGVYGCTARAAIAEGLGKLTVMWCDALDKRKIEFTNDRIVYVLERAAKERLITDDQRNRLIDLSHRARRDTP